VQRGHISNAYESEGHCHRQGSASAGCRAPPQYHVFFNREGAAIRYGDTSRRRGRSNGKGAQGESSGGGTTGWAPLAWVGGEAMQEETTSIRARGERS
jgi:hypothetical protein